MPPASAHALRSLGVHRDSDVRRHRLCFRLDRFSGTAQRRRRFGSAGCACGLTKVLACLWCERRVEVDGEVAQRRLQQHGHGVTRQWQSRRTKIRNQREFSKFSKIRDFHANFHFLLLYSANTIKIFQDMHKVLNVVYSDFLSFQRLKCKVGRSTSSRILARPSKLREIVVVLEAAVDSQSQPYWAITCNLCIFNC